jgi:hypothetical protein
MCDRALYNVLIILTHRLLVGKDPSNSSFSNRNAEASMARISAANEIVQILVVYEKHFNLSSATFALSYATYISAKVHLHILSHHGSHAVSLNSLSTCLRALDHHRQLYSASTRAKCVLEKLIQSMGISIESRAPAVSPAGQSQQDFEVSGPAQHTTSDETDGHLLNRPEQNLSTASTAATLDFVAFGSSGSNVLPAATGWEHAVMDEPYLMEFDNLYCDGSFPFEQ